MKFIDYVTITVRSGKGGAGAVAFRREKYEPLGGPAGGDGGHGGSVIMEGDAHLYTLLDLRYNRHHFAEKGQQGGGANKTGRDGADIVLRVPLGTIARDSATGELVGEVLRPGERVVLARGGRGGKGNAFFKGPTRQAPRFAQPGEPGEERELTLELKLLADVGLVGFPNAGKSTLVSSLSAARPKIADYPFTTLEPSLGVVDAGDYRSFVIADLPGIIQQASEGKGLGTRFLKHIERNAVLLFVIPIDSKDPRGEYDTLLYELKAFSADLLHKPRLLALTKTDLLPAEDLDGWIREIMSTLPPDLDVFPISAVARRDLEPLVRAMWERVDSVRSEREYDPTEQ
ncbi:MAG TPA: GTPase ObgE [Rhodothermales bacterium]